MARKLTSKEQRQFAKAVVLSEFCPLPTQADASSLRLLQKAEESGSTEPETSAWLEAYCRNPN